MLFAVKPSVGVVWKSLARLSISQTSMSATTTTRTFQTAQLDSRGQKATLNIPGAGPAPKRTPSIYALYMSEQFKLQPTDLSFNQKSRKIADSWKALTEQEKDKYKQQYDQINKMYLEEKAVYEATLSPEQRELIKERRNADAKAKNHRRIKSKLRELAYPKRPSSAFMSYLKELMVKTFPDGNYPSVRLQEQQERIKAWSKQWQELIPEQKQKYLDVAAEKKKRYYADLELWKKKMALPENEHHLKELELLTKINAPKPKPKVKKVAKKKPNAKKTAKKVVAQKTKSRKAATTIKKANKKPIVAEE